MHTERSGLILSRPGMSDEEIVGFLRGNGERLCPIGTGLSLCRGENTPPNYKHLLGRELILLAEILEKRFAEVPAHA